MRKRHPAPMLHPAPPADELTQPVPGFDPETSLAGVDLAALQLDMPGTSPANPVPEDAHTQEDNAGVMAEYGVWDEHAATDAAVALDENASSAHEGAVPDPVDADEACVTDTSQLADGSAIWPDDADANPAADAAADVDADATQQA